MGDTRKATAPVHTPGHQHATPTSTRGAVKECPGAHPPKSNPRAGYPDHFATHPASVQSEAPGSVEANALISAAPKARLSGHDDLNPTHHRSNKDGDPVPTATNYRLPRPGRKYLDATEQADLAARIAQRDYARQFTDQIRAAQTLTCPADTRFKHLITNDLTCVRCNEAAATILERNSA